MMKAFTKIAASAALLAVLPALGACAQNGTDEEATAKANAMGNDLQDSVSDMSTSMESSATEMGNDMATTASQMGDAVDGETAPADAEAQ
tara:strand:+ start:236 stop:505 length:270 start_codon:yes stop_codon:yes gene_type:complete